MRISIVLIIISVFLVTDIAICQPESRSHSHGPQESGPAAEVVRVRDLGPLKFPSIISARDLAYSTHFAGRSVWVFGDTILNSRAADQSRWRSSTWCWTRDFDARNGVSFHEPVDRRGAFFQDLGFSVNWEADGYAELQLGSAVFILQDFHNQTMQENLMLQAQVDDLDAWWQHIQKSGVLDRYQGVRAKEPTTFTWGVREVHLIDPAGVCWHFV